MNQQIDSINKKPPIQIWWLLLLLAIVFVPHLYYSYHLMVGNQTHDLHLRVLGTRLMEAGKNPYTYYWQVGDNMLWYDPNQSVYSSVNGVTSSPFFLWLQKPLLQLDYCSIRLVWFCIEEAFLFATLLLGLLLFNNRFRQLLFLLVAIAFFLFSRNWWLHVYNGQMYVLYAFVFMLCAYLLMKKGRNIGLWLYPVMALVRPLLVLSWLSMFRLNKKAIAASIIGGAVAVLLFVLPNNFNTWKQYKEALKVYATEATGGYDTVLRNREARQGNFPTEACLIREKKADFLHAGCLYSFQTYLSRIGFQCSDANIFSLALLLAVAVVLLLVYKFKLAVAPEQQIVLAILLYFLGELFAPASRNPYNMVQWLPIVAIVLAAGNRAVVGLLLFGLLLNHSLPMDFKYAKELGELLMFLSACLFIVKPMGSASIGKS